MSEFRLARLLKLRQDQSDAAKQQWALAQSAALASQNAVEAARARLEEARRELADGATKTTGARAAARAEGAHATLDALDNAIGQRMRESEVAGSIAAERRAEYQEAVRAVEALERLETRWNEERRARQRRKEARALDEFTSADAARKASASAGSPKAQLRTFSASGDDLRRKQS